MPDVTTKMTLISFKLTFTNLLEYGIHFSWHFSSCSRISVLIRSKKETKFYSSYTIWLGSYKNCKHSCVYQFKRTPTSKLCPFLLLCWIWPLQLICWIRKLCVSISGRLYWFWEHHKIKFVRWYFIFWLQKKAYITCLVYRHF